MNPRKTSDKSVTFNLGETIALLVGGCIVGAILAYQMIGSVAAIPVGLLLGPPILYFGVKHALLARKRDRDWCQANGWTRTGQHAFGGMADLHSSRVLWKLGNWSEIIEHGEGDSRVLFGYRYIDEGNDVNKRAAFLITRHGASCPDTTIESPHLTSWLPKVDGRHKVEFESESFNQHWRVFSQDPKSAFAYIDQSTIEYLEQNRQKCAIELVGMAIIVRFDDLQIGDIPGREASIRWFEGFSKAVPDDLLGAMTLLPPARG